MTWGQCCSVLAKNGFVTPKIIGGLTREANIDMTN